MSLWDPSSCPQGGHRLVDTETASPPQGRGQGSAGAQGRADACCCRMGDGPGCGRFDLDAGEVEDAVLGRENGTDKGLTA